MHEGYVEFLQGIYDDYECDEVVHIGDIVDWHSNSYHEQEVALKNPDAERTAAQKQVDTIVQAFPNARKRRLLTGNHDDLPYRKAKTAGLASDALFPLKKFWSLKGWSVVPRFEELVIDGVVYTHGEGRGGMYAHGQRALARGRSVVMGHLHSNAGVIWHANTESRLFGLAVGCGVDNTRLQFLYGKPFPRKPIIGCGVVIDGKQPYFEPMLLKSR